MAQAMFGPAGNAESFRIKYKKTTDVPVYIKEMGLDAYEYQCGRGVKISESSAVSFGQRAKECGVVLSIHAPYYISLSSPDPEKRDNSVSYIMQTAQAAKWMGATRIIIHSGSCGKMSREQALELARNTLKTAQEALDQHQLGDIIICPETMGKINQLGDLDEVMALCRVDDRMLPCIDFGHLNARTLGGMNTKQAFTHILDTIGNQLGSDRQKRFHSHFAKIEYTDGGEKRHLTFEDTQYGPDFEPLMELIAQKGLTPTIICESAGTQAEDAQTLKSTYLSAFDVRHLQQ